MSTKPTYRLTPVSHPDYGHGYATPRSAWKGHHGTEPMTVHCWFYGEDGRLSIEGFFPILEIDS